MATSLESRLCKIPPVRLWALDPLHRSYIKLFISQLHDLPEVPDFPGVFLVYDHPVTQFEAVGRIVSVDRKENMIKYGIDDGTGVIHCCFWLNRGHHDPAVASHRLGQLVTCLGKLNTYLGVRELKADRLLLEKDPNVEPFHWLNVISKNEVYRRPAVLPLDLLPPHLP